jgi:RHS repeat-associated protein
VIGLSLPGGAVLASSLATTPRPWGEQDNSGRTPLCWEGNHGYWSEYQLARPMHYVRARWYLDGGPGWLSPDPLGFGGGDWNLYRYVGNRPTVLVDPGGLSCLSDARAAGHTGSQIDCVRACGTYPSGRALRWGEPPAACNLPRTAPRRPGARPRPFGPWRSCLAVPAPAPRTASTRFAGTRRPARLRDP